MKKLISMADFVLELGKTNQIDLSNEAFIDVFLNYANFLKQPLTLGMFVPCDDDGNVLEEPDRWDDYVKAPESFDGNKEWYNLYAYEQAKERVLFEGFSLQYQSSYTIVVDNEKHEVKFRIRDTQIFTIETLVNKDLTLTSSALKQIGL